MSIWDMMAMDVALHMFEGKSQREAAALACATFLACEVAPYPKNVVKRPMDVTANHAQQILDYAKKIVEEYDVDQSSDQAIERN